MAAFPVTRSHSQTPNYRTSATAPPDDDASDTELEEAYQPEEGAHFKEENSLQDVAPQAPTRQRYRRLKFADLKDLKTAVSS